MKVIAASVLLDICKAISEDPEALDSAQKRVIFIQPEFAGALTEIAMHISNSDVRNYVLNELKGVEYDSNNK